LSDKITVRLSTGKVAELHPLSSAEQVRADCCAMSDPMRTEYYRIAASIKKLTLEDGTEVLIGPVLSSANLEMMIERLSGRDQDELRDAYKAQWTPFKDAILKKFVEIGEEGMESASTLESVLDFITELGPDGNRVFELTSGKKVAMREITARQQMQADSWTRGEVARIGYYRTGIAVASIDGQEVPPPETIEALDGVLRRFTGLDLDELGSAYTVVFSVKPEVLKNENSPPSSDSSTQ